MKEMILYKRILPHGPAVRIRRTSEDGVVPVTAVLEVDRRAGTPREGIGTPPSLMTAEMVESGLRSTRQCFEPFAISWHKFNAGQALRT